VHHGGKTTHLAELMKNTGKIEAWDLHVNRVKLVEENAKRLGILMITTKQKDALQYEEKYKETALLCSKKEQIEAEEAWKAVQESACIEEGRIEAVVEKWKREYRYQMQGSEK